MMLLLLMHSPTSLFSLSLLMVRKSSPLTLRAAIFASFSLAGLRPGETYYYHILGLQDPRVLPIATSSSSNGIGDGGNALLGQLPIVQYSGTAGPAAAFAAAGGGGRELAFKVSSRRRGGMKEKKDVASEALRLRGVLSPNP
jgi:hypothetical protein